MRCVWFAIAVVTQESMPPLSNTTAFGFCSPAIPALNPLRRRIPDELVKLQPQAHRERVGQDPLGQFTGAQSGPRSGRVRKYGRVQHLSHAFSKAVPGGEI